MDSVKGLMEAGRTVHVADMAAISYELDKGPASDEPIPRAFNFVWPNPDSREQLRYSIVTGALTGAARASIEERALAETLPAGKGADTLIWRVEPTWESERAFESDTTRHRFFMRGAFIWSKDNG